MNERTELSPAQEARACLESMRQFQAAFGSSLVLAGGDDYEDDCDCNDDHDDGLSTQAMSNKEWLEFYCKEMRDKLQDTLRFDRDALLYRTHRDALVVFRTKVETAALAARKTCYTPLSHKVRDLILLRHPNDWNACKECHGNNRDKPDCMACFGCGYQTASDRA